AAWSYFDDIDYKTMRCLLCGLVVKKQRNTSGMLRHLRVKHPELLPIAEKEDDSPSGKRRSSQSPVPSEWMSSIIIEPQPDGCLGVCQESHITKPVKDASQEIIDIEKKKLR
ncbi:unnamed protein product, partial [Meganyctiphanes norvegica]